MSGVTTDEPEAAPTLDSATGTNGGDVVEAEAAATPVPVPEASSGWVVVVRTTESVKLAASDEKVAVGSAVEDELASTTVLRAVLAAPADAPATGESRLEVGVDESETETLAVDEPGISPPAAQRMDMCQFSANAA